MAHFFFLKKKKYLIYASEIVNKRFKHVFRSPKKKSSDYL